MKKNRIGIVIDYTLRTPDFINAYYAFYGVLCTNEQMEFVEEDSNAERINSDGIVEVLPLINEEMFWAHVSKDLNVMKFYHNIMNNFKEEFELNKKNNKHIKPSELINYFYNEEHYNRFLVESSYLMYSKAEKYDRDYYTYLNLMSKKFEIELIDIGNINLKRNNTISFLNRNPINFKSLVFLNSSEEIEKERYFWVYDNHKNENTHSADEFLNILKEVEANYDRGVGGTN